MTEHAAIDRVAGLISMGVGVTEQEYRDALAEVWREAYQAGCEDERMEAEEPSPNPYEAECTPKAGWLSRETYCAIHGREAAWPCRYRREESTP